MGQSIRRDTQFTRIQNIQDRLDRLELLSGTDWIVMTPFLNSFTAGSPTPSYRRDRGIVYLRGVVARASTPSANTAIFNLPVGFRPETFRSYAVDDSGTGAANVSVGTDGNITYWSGNVSAIYLDNIQFHAL